MEELKPAALVTHCQGVLAFLFQEHSICTRKSVQTRKGGERFMELLKRLLVEEDGQGLVEYTLMVVLVALVFWVAIKKTNIGSHLASAWSKVTACVQTPSSCTSSS